MRPVVPCNLGPQALGEGPNTRRIFVKILRWQASVVVTPGTEFSPHTGDSVRFNFSQDHKAAVAAVERIAALIERYRA